MLAGKAQDTSWWKLRPTFGRVRFLLSWTNRALGLLWASGLILVNRCELKHRSHGVSYSLLVKSERISCYQVHYTHSNQSDVCTSDHDTRLPCCCYDNKWADVGLVFHLSWHSATLKSQTRHIRKPSALNRKQTKLSLDRQHFCSSCEKQIENTGYSWFSAKSLIKMDEWCRADRPMNGLQDFLLAFFCFESQIEIFTNQARASHVHQRTVTADFEWSSFVNGC